MRSAGIVIAAPCFDDPARHWQAPKDVFVEALIPEAAVEAFDKGVLDRLSGGDVVPSNAAFLLPAQDGVRSSSVPLSLTIINGFPRAATMASSSRATRRPEIDVSTPAPGTRG